MKIVTTLTFCLLPLFLWSQQFSRVKVDLTNTSILQLAELGLDVEHGHYVPQKFFTSDFADYEIEQMTQAGFSLEILIEDVQAHYVNQNNSLVEERSQNCVGGDDLGYETPENFELGSMGGFYTYQEMLDELDAMYEQYPDLITQRSAIGDALTHEGREVYWLKITDNPNEDEAEEPEILYTAVHHAREPNGLTQMIFYMWYLLENYETDPQVQFIVNNTELAFIPCVNPDGYIFNETTNPSGGGLWRKNRRLNDDGSYGVDLNRNYGFGWGYSDTGSSPNPESQVYRGPSPFSEPEAQAVRDFCNDHEFVVALNYHTFGNLLIYPWGYLDTPTAEGDVFTAIANSMTAENNYLAGTATETVGYQVNGVTDDWMYGETDSKPPIYAFTPEVGISNQGFWPPSNEITPNSKKSMWMNLVAALVPHNYGDLQPDATEFISSIDGAINYELSKLGLLEGDLTVTLSPVSSNILSTGDPISYTLDQGQSVNDAIPFTLDASIQEGEEVVFEMSVFNGDLTISQELVKIFSTSGPVFEDEIEGITNWDVDETSQWSFTPLEFLSPPYSMADSPIGNYDANDVNVITLDQYIQITDATLVKLNFWAKWEIEAFYDYAQVQIAIDNDNFFPVCGKYTIDGSVEQDPGQPVYEGFQDSWVQEDIDLTEFVEVGDSLALRFVMVSDGGLEYDGFFFDDLTVTVIGEDVSSSTNEVVQDVNVKVVPNPSSRFFDITVNQKGADLKEGQIIFYNAIGQPVYQSNLMQAAQQTLTIITTSWSEGIYYYQVILEEEYLKGGSLMIK